MVEQANLGARLRGSGWRTAAWILAGLSSFFLLWAIGALGIIGKTIPAT